jgi:NAD(P)-dependent dehydrogenase (short-subunit alcohol dehydrogenase family)
MTAQPDSWPTFRRAIVTGAARGLGAGLATTFVASGHEVLLVDVDEEVRARAEQLGEAAGAMMADLVDATAADEVIAAAVDRWGGCDVLVNNAAWSLHRSFLDITPAEFDRLIAVNQRAPFLLAQRFAALPATGDRLVVNISSVNAVSGNRNLVAYAGSKGALEAMTRAMAVELAPLGIRVNAIRPGAIDSPALHDTIAKGLLDPEEYWREFPIGEPTRPEDIAAVVLLLLGPAARTITGAVWTIDGGFTAH